MKQRKRSFALLLAVVMLVGMIVFAAPAAALDFTDEFMIANKDAVTALMGMSIISGKGDGSHFDPGGIVTRAEMAKMLAVALNGGNPPAPAGTSAFADTRGHWAETYIEYCAALGIVAGRGGGRFDPNATVTGAEAAKMMLVAMKYDPAAFGLQGTNWFDNTNAVAISAGLYKGLNGMDPSAALTRDNAAQLIFNGIQARTVKPTWERDPVTGQTVQNYVREDPSIFEDKYNGTIVEGTLWNYEYNLEKGGWIYIIGFSEIFDAVDDSDHLNVLTYELPSAVDYRDLATENVVALYSIERNGDIKTYVIYPADSAAADEEPLT